MDTTVVVLATLAVAMVGMFASGRSFMIALAIYMPVLVFGPVAYRFALTGDTSLGWEAAFRVARILIGWWGVKRFLALHDEFNNSTKH